MTKLKKLKLWLNLSAVILMVVIVKYFSKCNFSEQRFDILAMFFFIILMKNPAYGRHQLSWGVQKLALCQNTKHNCDKILKLKLWQNSKIPIVTKLKISKCDQAKSTNFDLTQKLLLLLLIKPFFFHKT